MRFDIEPLLARLPLPATAQWPHGLPSIEAHRHGSMLLKLFAPRIDHQSPHLQDELYVVARGSARFEVDGRVQDVGAGSALYVDAGAPHRFTDCSADFCTWVVFWGPAHGEPAACTAASASRPPPGADHPMSSAHAAAAFADRWLAVWNERQPQAIAALYAPDVRFCSPMLPLVRGTPEQVLRGRDALRRYVEQALANVPELHFEPMGATLGPESLTLVYRGHRQRLVTERLVFDDAGLIAASEASYAIRARQP